MLNSTSFPLDKKQENGDNVEINEHNLLEKWNKRRKFIRILLLKCNKQT